MNWKRLDPRRPSCRVCEKGYVDHGGEWTPYYYGYIFTNDNDKDRHPFVRQQKPCCKQAQLAGVGHNSRREAQECVEYHTR